tara:strand:- start:9828 stop:10082 length:255 start_codon:yes stop_codon:yes gene_type:complete
MDISKWNAIMKSFQDLMGYQPGINEVLVTKRLSAIGFKDIEKISGREEKYLVHILRKRYREISDDIKREKDKGKDRENRNNLNQ